MVASEVARKLALVFNIPFHQINQVYRQGPTGIHILVSDQVTHTPFPPSHWCLLLYILLKSCRETPWPLFQYRWVTFRVGNQNWEEFIIKSSGVLGGRRNTQWGGPWLSSHRLWTLTSVTARLQLPGALALFMEQWGVWMGFPIWWLVLESRLGRQFSPIPSGRGKRWQKCTCGNFLFVSLSESPAGTAPCGPRGDRPDCGDPWE